MTKFHIAIFILVLICNGIVALWKKHKERQEQQAAAKLARSAGGAQAIDERIAVRQARRVQVQQPPVIAPSPRPPASAGAQVAFEDIVRIEMRRLAAMQAVLNAAGSSAGGATGDATGGIEAIGTPSAVGEPASPGGSTKAGPRRRLLGAVSLRNAILAREVLGPPRSARPWTGTVA